MTLVEKALVFATEAHGSIGQKRKYTGEDYIVHPIEVMEIVKSVPHTQEMLAAALLHDTVEDTPVDFEDIEREFGKDVLILVQYLTDISKPTDGNRRRRKEIDREHLRYSSPDAKTIKLADLISNSKTITEFDKHFARVYMKEKELLLECLTDGNPTLYARAKQIVETYNKEK